MNVTNRFKRVLSILCSILLLVTPLYASFDYVKAKDRVTKTASKSEYTEIINNVTNITSSDEVTILIDYNGGISNGKTTMTLTKYPEESFGIISPKREDCVFSGWEILSGDSSIEWKNGSYILTVGSQDTIIRAIWKTEKGEEVIETPVPTPEVSTKPAIVPSPTPVQRYINVTVSLEGGTYNGESVITQQVADRNTIVLFENVDLLRKDGYKVTGFECNCGGSCQILSDKRVLYTAPSYDNTKLELINVVWEKIDDNPSGGNINATPGSRNTVYINLDGGKFNSDGKQEAIIYTDTNTTKLLFKTSDIKKEGYTLKEFEITDGVKYLIQGEDVILLATEYKTSGITMKAIWEKVTVITPQPTIQATDNTNVPTLIPTQMPTSEATARPENNTNLNTIPPTSYTTSTIELNKSPVLSGLTLKSNTIHMGVGESVPIHVTETQNVPVRYETQDKLICSVTSNGIIYGLKTGQTQIVVTAGGTTQKITVYVLQRPTKIGLTSKMKKNVTYAIKKGKTKKLRVFVYKNSYSNKITFTSSNKKIATVTSKGIVKAIKKGSCKITVKSYNGKKAIATIKVK